METQLFDRGARSLYLVLLITGTVKDQVGFLKMCMWNASNIQTSDWCWPTAATNTNGQEELVCLQVRLVDDQTFETTDRMALDVHEQACSLISASFADDPEVKKNSCLLPLSILQQTGRRENKEDKPRTYKAPWLIRWNMLQSCCSMAEMHEQASGFIRALCTGGRSASGVALPLLPPRQLHTGVCSSRHSRYMHPR